MPPSSPPHVQPPGALPKRLRPARPRSFKPTAEQWAFVEREASRREVTPSGYLRDLIDRARAASGMRTVSAWESGFREGRIAGHAEQQRHLQSALGRLGDLSGLKNG